MAGIGLASRERVPEMSMSPMDHEPTVMWRMRRADGLSSHAVIGPRTDGSLIVMWFVNGRPLGSRAFGDWTSALRWSDQMRAQNWTVGWRLVSEYDDSPDPA